MSLGTRLPSTTEEAQFNLAWPVAAFLVDGEVGPTQILEERLASPTIRSLSQRIEVRVSEELSRLYYLSEANDPMGKDAAIVSVTLSDGRVLSSGLVENVLYPEQPWGTDEIEAKFVWLTAPHMQREASNRVAALIANVDGAKDVGLLMDEITAALTPLQQSRRGKS